MAAAVRDQAARAHERLADLGSGNVEEHRAQARRHRQQAEADRAEAEQDRSR
jgi:hypothetical protein